MQIGLVSSHSYCETANTYNVFTRIASFADWVQACMGKPESNTCTGGDEYEPDNDPEHATLMRTDEGMAVHNFHSQEDYDWLKFEAQAGTHYFIDSEGIGDLSDTLLWLYDSNGLSAITYSEGNGPGTSAHIRWRAPRDDTFYVQVQDHAGATGEASVYGVTIKAHQYLGYLPLIVGSTAR